MNIFFIPGFLGHPDEITFKDLEKQLNSQGHNVIKIAWPHFPDDLAKYSISETLKHTREILKKLDMNQTIILGFSMGGIIASFVAKEFQPKKLGLFVSPYQAGTDDDLEEKYNQWQEDGFRKFTSSKYGELKIPFSFILDAKKYNALDVINMVNCPILFIAGKKDDKVSNNATEKFFKKANYPKKFILIDEMEHRYQYQPKMLEKVNGMIGGGLLMNKEYGIRKM